MQDIQNILIGSPICQQPEVLELFLLSLSRLSLPGFAVFYHFIDDNHNEASKELLARFAGENDRALVETLRPADDTSLYMGHIWTEPTIWKVARYKDRLINRAKAEGFDFLFLVDSDILLHPETVGHLTRTGKDIVSEVFWTKWATNAIEQPQVWLYDFYRQYEMEPGETLTKEEEWARTLAFYHMLRTPGTYPVGGLGACTVIARPALEQGVSFAKIPNLTMWGEDRHFCIRACAAGLALHADTFYPPYHVYRPEELPGGIAFLEKTAP